MNEDGLRTNWSAATPTWPSMFWPQHRFGPWSRPRTYDDHRPPWRRCGPCERHRHRCQTVDQGAIADLAGRIPPPTGGASVGAPRTRVIETRREPACGRRSDRTNDQGGERGGDGAARAQLSNVVAAPAAHALVVHQRTRVCRTRCVLHHGAEGRQPLRRGRDRGAGAYPQLP